MIFRRPFPSLILLFTLWLSHGRGVAQDRVDTIQLSLDSAEKIFLTRNLSLLASHYNVEVSKALVIQAKLWNNPNFQFGQGAYNTASHRFFELNGPNSIQSAQLQQLFILAGKRNKQVNIAQINSKIAEYSFFDLLRTLKAQLRTDYFSIYYLRQSASVYHEEIASLEKIASVFSSQVEKGNISKKEEIRIQSQLFSLQSEYAALRQQILVLESDFNLLLRNQHIHYQLTVDTATVNRYRLNRWQLTRLVDSALASRYDLKASDATYALSRQSLNLQKALATPDLTLGLSYASNGSAAPNYYLLFASIDLPFFNRNQGNIKAAKFALEQTRAQYQSQKEGVLTDVQKAYTSIKESQEIFRHVNPQFIRDFTSLIKEVLKNYQLRNLSLLEFLDFYDSYKQNVLQSNSLRLNRVLSFEQINYVVGKDLIF